MTVRPGTDLCANSDLQRKMEPSGTAPRIVHRGVRKRAIYACIGFSYLRGGDGIAGWCRRNVFPQRFPPASCDWKRICHINAQSRRKRGVSGIYETPNVEWPNG